MDLPGFPAHYVTALVDKSGWIWMNDDKVRHFTNSSKPPTDGTEYVLVYQKQAVCSPYA